MASLTDKTALVTGASRGIGRATAQALANAGAHVIVHYGRSAAEAGVCLPHQALATASGCFRDASACGPRRHSPLTPLPIKLILL